MQSSIKTGMSHTQLKIFPELKLYKVDKCLTQLITTFYHIAVSTRGNRRNFKQLKRQMFPYFDYIVINKRT